MDMRTRICTLVMACIAALSLQAKDYHYTTVPGDLTQTRI